MNLEQLTPREFEAHLAKGTFRLAFVGMSNVGKSYRSRILRDECNFFWYHVDGEIHKTLVFDSMDGISKWLGYPNTEGYVDRAAQYLAAEDKHTKVDFLDTEGKNLVFDTTGSVIYLPKSTHAWLRENCLIINIDAGEGTIAQMMEQFLIEPKPLIWQEFFSPVEGESERETIERCYPKLLEGRLKKYRALAHVTIPVALLHNKSGAETLELIKEHLEKIRNASPLRES
ncbi:hypothetical protein K2Q08_02245 [Patescibacteria group bacterium]|nr:hypothetical protein [Patescibacteria group bacterium]